jgi:hypothetical protein
MQNMTITKCALSNGKTAAKGMADSLGCYI